MAGWSCFCCGPSIAAGGDEVRLPEPFQLPAPLPVWPQGGDFSKGTICIGELEVASITKFQSIWSCSGATFYEPQEIPDGFHCLGHYAQQNSRPLQGFLLVAREAASFQLTNGKPALEKPLDYTLVWSSADLNGDDNSECGCLWSPSPPDGYEALGYVVTRGPKKPSIEAVRCVRGDLTDECENFKSIAKMGGNCYIWNTRPCHRGMAGRGIPVGTFFCGTDSEESDIPCLKNFDKSLRSMPNLDQIKALIEHYGPTVFFHPQEIYLPSSVSWFFENGATLHKKGKEMAEVILASGSNLPVGGTNDGEYWIDIPDDDDKNKFVKAGNLKSAELYDHVKPAHGGTFTDIAMWVFCPFNGPATIKVGFASFALQKVGRHTGDWEHFTLRISNFSGELSSIYFSQHSGGEWVDACNLEFISGNKAIVYSAKDGHASYAHPGCYLLGSEKAGVGVRNDAARSNFSVDSSTRYKIISAGHLGDAVVEPCWLQYMREWGPTVEYNSRSEIDAVLSFLPFFLRFTAEAILNSLPVELYEEEGPTGPKEKNNWEGDERG